MYRVILIIIWLTTLTIAKAEDFQRYKTHQHDSKYQIHQHFKLDYLPSYTDNSLIHNITWNSNHKTYRFEGVYKLFIDVTEKQFKSLIRRYYKPNPELIPNLLEPNELKPWHYYLTDATRPEIATIGNKIEFSDVFKPFISLWAEDQHISDTDLNLVEPYKTNQELKEEYSRTYDYKLNRIRIESEFNNKLSYFEFKFKPSLKIGNPLNNEYINEISCKLLIKINLYNKEFATLEWFARYNFKKDEALTTLSFEITSW